MSDALDTLAAVFSPHGYPLWLVVTSLVAFALERARPWRRQQRVRRRQLAQDVGWLLLNGHIMALVLASPSAWLADHTAQVFAFVGLPAPSTLALVHGAPFALQVLVVLVVKDLLDWCIHNTLHRVPFLWSFHKVHHTIEELDWIGSLRFHWMEIVIYGAVTYLPVTMLGAGGDALLVAAVIGTFVGHLNHANLDVDYGPLKYVFNSPKMHVWHHARLAPGSRGANYAIVFSTWDWLFRTVQWPAGQPDRLGFDDDDVYPRSLVGRFVWPLSKLRRALTSGRP